MRETERLNPRRPSQRRAHSPKNFHAGFRADLGLQRVYPWVLFAPYVALVAFGFPLERGHLRLNLPLNLAACVAFLVASRALSARTSTMGTNLVIIKSHHQSDASAGTQEANKLHAELTRIDGRKLLHEQSGGLGMEQSLAVRQQGAVALKTGPNSDNNLTQMLAELPPDLKPALSPLPAPKFNLVSTLLDLMAYGAVLGLAHSVHFYRRFREREHRALLLESNLAHARLTALRAQLQPHFLFNSLNAIATLLRRDARLAEASLMSLSELLRLALGRSERQEVTLREEMQFVERYLEIQQTRFGEKLRVEQEIEPATLDCLVPTLLLQPLVENAIRHGIEPADNAGLVRLTAHRHDRLLELTVEDKGAGLAHAATGTPHSEAAELHHRTMSSEVALKSFPAVDEVSKGGTGIGLNNLRARLETLYGIVQTLELLPRPEGGVIVRVTIPWHTLTPADVPENSNS